MSRIWVCSSIRVLLQAGTPKILKAVRFFVIDRLPVYGGLDQSQGLERGLVDQCSLPNTRKYLYLSDRLLMWVSICNHTLKAWVGETNIYGASEEAKKNDARVYKGSVHFTAMPRPPGPLSKVQYIIPPHALFA